MFLYYGSYVFQYFMRSKQRKILSLCIKLANLIQTQRFRSSYLNFIFKLISLSSYISSSDVNTPK